MNYTIYTPSSEKLKKEILERVTEKIDANGKGIANWQCVETDSDERVLVQTNDQWAEKGCIALNREDIRNELHVRFHYWDSCIDKSNDDEKIMLGRFTKLILVHFSYLIDKIIIE